MFGGGVKTVAKNLVVCPETFEILIDGYDDSDGIVVGELLESENSERNRIRVAAVGSIVVTQKRANCCAVVVWLN